MSCSSSSGSEEEDESMDSYRKGGYHAVRVGDMFSGGRYIAQRKLGWGEFSTVWLAYDSQTSKYVALKIQKSAREFAQSAIHEIEVVSALTKHDPENKKCVIRLVDHFKHRGPNGQHFCMVFEFLGDSILQLIKYNRYKGLPLNKVRDICRCILTALDYLHRQLGIIHTDLKPENILLVSTINPSNDPIRSKTSPILSKPEGGMNNGSRYVSNSIEKKLKQRARLAVARIISRRASLGGVRPVTKTDRCLDGIDFRCKVVDFGNACWANRPIADEIQTRQYRAPEVILQSGYSYSADMWSFACTAFELATGEMMFAPKIGQGISEDEAHLALMMEMLGKIPRKIAVGGVRSKDYFDRYGDLKRIRRLKHCPLTCLLTDKFKFSVNDARDFADFLIPILDFAPEKRPTARQCLQHPWLNKSSEFNAQNVDSQMSKLQIK
ncbi:hypothetical protein M8C21_010180 [Ambrosia artemisiifolia]|uniref:non-specific serine/threonine protein kinase n=1 Tax=Ambrosia artemisiifolia TaxID=4212 RepID=A0AAD5BQQ6_AMBAR|nr:hypothetical protein M8C21_010180 [Ambrosia artemisiifolia]